MISETLYIDSNEPDDVKMIVEATIKDRDTGVSTEIKGLKTGDFVYNNVVIERKEASDLASSIKERRLKEQTARMLKDFEHQYLLVEDNPYDLKYSNLHDNSFIGTLVSRAHAGIKIVYTPDKEGTAYAINKIISKHQGGETEEVKLEKTNVETEDTFVAMLSCVNGVSKKKAKSIKKQTCFESVGGIAVYDQPKKELKNVKGIGDKLSKRIIEEI